MANDIFKLLPKVAGEIGPIAKGRENKEQRYKFRGIEDVMNAINPVLSANGVTAVPSVVSNVREQRTTKSGGTMTFSIMTVKYTFFASDGSFIEATVVGEGMDSGDKSSNKAMSAAFKYALSQVFSIPFDVSDSEEDQPQPPKNPIKPAADTYSEADIKRMFENALAAMSKTPDLEQLAVYKSAADKRPFSHDQKSRIDEVYNRRREELKHPNKQANNSEVFV